MFIMNFFKIRYAWSVFGYCQLFSKHNTSLCWYNCFLLDFVLDHFFGTNYRTLVCDW